MTFIITLTAFLVIGTRVEPGDDLEVGAYAVIMAMIVSYAVGAQ